MSVYEIAVRDVVSAAGGRLVGKTRLQKTVYILKIAGLAPEFPFSYHYYGPYSEDLASSAKDAMLDSLISEHEDIAQWGGRYSVFTTEYKGDLNPAVRNVVSTACASDPVTLELAATAAFLKISGIADCWGETRRRKPQKATDERLDLAKALWEKLRALDTPEPLPAL